jgi:predicted nucleic acid-binding protein
MAQATAPGGFFLDTNIFVYLFDAGAPHKQARAQALVREAIASGAGVVSGQVVQEFCNVALRKFAKPLTAAECQRVFAQMFAPLLKVGFSGDLLASGLEIHAQSGYAFYDSMIVAAAQQAGCTTLYSEDLQHNHALGNLRIVNPFAQELQEPAAHYLVQSVRTVKKRANSSATGRKTK